MSFVDALAMPLLSSGGGAAASGLSALGGPIGLGLGALQMGFGFMQSQTEDAARRQQYLNETAFQNASTQFNQWQARFNANLGNLNNQYSYWRDTVNHNQQLAYTSQLRGYEFAKGIAQAQRVLEAKAGAGANYIAQSEGLQNQLQERGMQEAVAMQQYTYRALQQSAAFQAAAQEGRSTDRYVANFSRQVGDYATLQQIGRQFQERQFRRDQLGAMTTYLNQYNSQQLYERTPYMDPVAPFPPLPTMVMPSGPSMTGAAPRSNGFLNATTNVLGGVRTGLDFASGINKLANG